VGFFDLVVPPAIKLANLVNRKGRSFAGGADVGDKMTVFPSEFANSVRLGGVVVRVEVAQPQLPVLVEPKRPQFPQGTEYQREAPAAADLPDVSALKDQEGLFNSSILQIV
jgi:hypothetical protein